MSETPETPEKLREEAVKYFNETLDLMQKGTNEEAFKTYALLLKNSPDDPEYLSYTAMTLNNLGILFSEKGQKAEAKDNFEKALEILKKMGKKDPGNEKLREEISLTRKRLETI